MQFIGALVFITTMLLFCVAVGIFASVLHRDGNRAQMTAVSIVGALMVVPLAVQWITPLITGTAVSRPWRTFSPLWGAYEVFSGFAGGTTGGFWSALGFWSTLVITLSYTFLALLAGAVLLHRTWRDPIEVIEPARSGQRWGARLAGGRRWRGRLRRELKAGNPLCWRAARNRTAVFVSWVFTCAVLSVWLGGCLIFGGDWSSGGNLLVTSIVLHLGLNWALAGAAARWLAEERQSGGFEMLLSAPVTVNQLVEGQRRALVLQFWNVLRLIFSVDLALCFGGLWIREWEAHTLINYFVVWALLILFWFGVHLRTAYRAMWIGAWTGRPAYSAAQAGLGIVWACLIFMLPLWGAWLENFPMGTTEELVVAGMALVLAAAGMFGSAGKVREKLERELRDIACAPIPKPGDKRFRNWDPDKVFPPGRWGELLLVPGKKQPTRPLDALRATSQQ